MLFFDNNPCFGVHFLNLYTLLYYKSRLRIKDIHLQKVVIVFILSVLPKHNAKRGKGTNIQNWFSKNTHLESSKAFGVRNFVKDDLKTKKKSKIFEKKLFSIWYNRSTIKN